MKTAVWFANLGLDPPFCTVAACVQSMPLTQHLQWTISASKRMMPNLTTSSSKNLPTPWLRRSPSCSCKAIIRHLLKYTISLLLQIYPVGLTRNNAFWRRLKWALASRQTPGVCHKYQNDTLVWQQIAQRCKDIRLEFNFLQVGIRLFNASDSWREFIHIHALVKRNPLGEEGWILVI